MSKTVEQTVKDVIANALYVSHKEVVPEANFVDDLGADSLDAVEMIMALEEEFDIVIPDEDAEKLTTVQEAVDYVEKKVDKEKGD